MKKGLPQHAWLIIFLQICFFVLFCIFVRYDVDADARFNPISNNETEHIAEERELTSGDGTAHVATYPLFQDVHVMVFLGIGFLMTFLKKYGFSSVGLNFLIGALCIEWAILVNGFFHLHHGYILVNIGSLVGADFSAATVLISFGVVLGKTTPTQLVIMAMIEIPLFVINEVIGRQLLGAIDMGDSMYIHIFAAYFGLAVSLILNRSDVSTPKEGSSYRSDLFSMIGTIFLWLYWPSFNAAGASGDDQHRAIINTYLSLCACTLTSFAISSLIGSQKKFDIVHVQNSTLAGGVAIGTAGDLMVQPWGAVLVGIIAGVISVLGYTYLSPLLSSKLRIHDTCGVHNLHGMPGILAGIVGAVLAAVASESSYGVSLYQIFPARAPLEGSPDLARISAIIPGVEAGSGISGTSQAFFQIMAILVSLAFAIAGGLLTGLILRLGPLQTMETKDLYEDSKFWLLEGGDESGSEAEGMAMAKASK